MTARAEPLADAGTGRGRALLPALARQLVGGGPTLRYVVRRILWACFLLLAMTFVTFALFYVAPVSTAHQTCGRDATAECIADVTHELALDKPLTVQYARYIERLVVHQSLGYSWADGRTVNEIVANAAPVTASLVLPGLVFVLVVALVGGLASALKPRSLLDRGIMVYILFGASMPAFWFALCLSYLFGVRLRWAPIGGYADFFNPAPGQPGGPGAWAAHLALPWLAFTLVGAALYARMIRASVIETRGEDYVRTAIAKGAGRVRVLRAHVLRNALLPLVTMLGIDLGVLFAGSFFIERVFGLPGLGVTAVQAIGRDDLMTVQGVVIVATSAIVVFNLLVDLLYAWIDPRVRLPAG